MKKIIKIKNKLKNKKDLSSTSIEYLFNLIGFESYSHINGEWFTFYEEWYRFFPVFFILSISDDYKDIEKLFTKKEMNKYNFKKVHNLFYNKK
jgi:hypothetical protein